MKRYKIVEVQHPLPPGSRVEFGGKRGTVIATSWTPRIEGHDPMVRVRLDDGGLWMARDVREISAVERLGDLA
ncbi:MAG TPA: hypothetical protein VFH61_17230 [Thermoleophilia bacterium]|nr:hypothetical protein [Thermoleophilia bacterium]